MLQWERRGLDEERQHLIEWGSLLKKWTASEKEKATKKRERLDKMEGVLKEVAIGLLDAQAQELMEKSKELYATAEARADANIKMQEDLNGQAIGLAQRERMVVGREQDVQEKEEEVTSLLEHGRSELLSHEADVNTHEIALGADRKSLGDLRADILARELTAKLKANHLAFREELADREKKLADKEKWLAERKPQELATARKRLEELQAARTVEAEKVWDFLGQTKTALVPISFSPLHSRDPVWEVSAALPLIDSIGAKMLKLEEVIGEQLEAEGHALAEHVLTCFRS
jgi:hypothetical protein